MSSYGFCSYGENTKVSIRLQNFDYSKPFFYMVTIKKMKGISPFSSIVAPGKCELNGITKAFVSVIRGFHQHCPGIEPIGRFSIMPDHIHFAVKLTGSAVTGMVSLPMVVAQFIMALEHAYWQVKAHEGEAEAQVMLTRIEAGKAENIKPVFSADWHDWIVKREGQLEAFTRYIRENPQRSWRRKENTKYFNRVRPAEFLGRQWYGYGNLELLNLPVLEPFQCSRKLAEGGEVWSAAIAAAGRIGPGGAAVSTFMSPCENACGHEVWLAGGKFIVLTPENFPPAEGETVSPEGWRTRWHPGRKQETACANGDLVYISLYEPMSRQATDAELFKRCHEMGDFVVNKLGGHKWM